MERVKRAVGKIGCVIIVLLVFALTVNLFGCSRNSSSESDFNTEFDGTGNEENKTDQSGGNVGGDENDDGEIGGGDVNDGDDGNGDNNGDGNGDENEKDPETPGDGDDEKEENKLAGIWRGWSIDDFGSKEYTLVIDESGNIGENSCYAVKDLFSPEPVVTKLSGKIEDNRAAIDAGGNTILLEYDGEAITADIGGEKLTVIKDGISLSEFTASVCGNNYSGAITIDTVYYEYSLVFGEIDFFYLEFTCNSVGQTVYTVSNGIVEVIDFEGTSYILVYDMKTDEFSFALSE